MVQVVWSPAGLAQFRTHYDRIARDSVLTAEKWRAKVEKAVGLLAAVPEIGAPVEELGWSGVREQIVGSYRVLYVYDGTTCKVGAVVRAERDLRRAVAPEDFI